MHVPHVPHVPLVLNDGSSQPEAAGIIPFNVGKPPHLAAL